MAGDGLNGGIDNLGYVASLIGAVGALGTAAFGLVDVSKIFGDGVSNVGFDHIRRALDPFAPALEAAAGAQWAEILNAHWRNGRDKADQKAIAKALIRLGLGPANAELVAAPGHVDPEALRETAAAVNSGEELTPAQLNTLGRFDASVDMLLDAAFERADHRYRNVARSLAAFVAVVLAVWGGALVTSHPGWAYVTSGDVAKALLIGLVAVPVAPLSKDLVSSLSAAVRAVKAAKR